MKNKGFVLITALLFLFLLSLLAIPLLESVILHQKMQNMARLHQRLFNLANAGLRQGEHTLENSCNINLCIQVNLLSKFNKKKESEPVEISYYQITSSAKSQQINVTLQSTYAIFSQPLSEFDGIFAGRQSWREVK